MIDDLKKTLKRLDRDEILDRLGLERKNTAAEQIVPALAIFGAGVLVGVGLGMIFAPRSGQELRGQLQSKLKSVEQRVRGNGGETAAVPSPSRPSGAV